MTTAHRVFCPLLQVLVSDNMEPILIWTVPVQALTWSSLVKFGKKRVRPPRKIQWLESVNCLLLASENDSGLRVLALQQLEQRQEVHCRVLPSGSGLLQPEGEMPDAESP